MSASGPWLTCATLARSTAPGARELLFAALEPPDAAMQSAAARAILLYARSDGIPRLIASFRALAPEVADELVRSVDEMAHALRSALASGPVPMRANAVEILRRAGRVRLAYLVVEAISDADAAIANAALDALARLVEVFRRDAERARAGELDLGREELEAHRFALLEPLLVHLGDLSRPQPEALMLLAMGLDGRANDLLFGVLNSRRDPRAEPLERLLRNAASPHVASFLFDALRDRRVAAFAAGVFQSRRDLPFVRATLSNARFFTDFRVRESLRSLDPLDVLSAPNENSSENGGTDIPVCPRVDGQECLSHHGVGSQPGSIGEAAAPAPRRDVFAGALLALRAIHFLALSGTPAPRRQAFLEAIARGDFPAFVTGLAESVSRAFAAGRTPEQISPALAWLEGEMGLRAGVAQPPPAAASSNVAHPLAPTKERPSGVTSSAIAQARAPVPHEAAGESELVPELDLPWAHPDAQSLPADAFTQFFNAYDRLDEATRLLAAENLKRLGPSQLERLRDELSGVAPERRLRAVKIVVTLHREQYLEPALLALASDDDRHVRATVVKTLGILEDEPAVRALLEAVTDADRRVVANSVEAIEQTGRGELAGLARIFASHPNNRIRANAVKALFSLGERDASDLLDAMLADPDEMMRLSATWVLGEIDHPRRIEKLATVAANDPSDRVRAKARGILGG